MKIKINNVWYEIDEGSVITENYNETLDSATIRISNQTSEIKMEPFDTVILSDSENRIENKYMMIDTYSSTMICINPVIYQYEISLFSETKALEGIILPNLSITPLTIAKNKDNSIAFEKVEEKVLPVGINDITINIPELQNVTIQDINVSSSGGGYFPSISNVDIETGDVSIHFQTSTGQTATFTITGHYNYKRSVYYYLKQYNDEYGPKIKVGDEEVWDYQNKYTYSQNLINRFSAIECPEMQFNEPTLRELINQLLMIDDCICVVKNNVIDFIDITETKNDVSQNNKINYIQKSQSSEDYVSELRMNMVNNLQDTEPDINTTTTVTQWVPFTTSGYLINSNNYFIKTRYPILRIKSFKLFNVRNVSNTLDIFPETVDISSFDLMRPIRGRDAGYWEDSPLVVEKELYDTKIILRKLGAGGRLIAKDFNTWSKYQNFCLHYSRGGNTIEGFTNETKFKSGGKTFNTIQYLWFLFCGLMYAGTRDIDDYFIQDTIDDMFSENLSGVQFYFKIEYETTTDCLFQASKTEYPKNYRVINDNQTNSFVNPYNQGFLEYQKANRLGNEILLINARIQENDTLIKIGDYYNDSVVYQTQYAIFKDHIDVNAQATKNYILRDYFTGVKSRVRTFQLITKETTDRNELIKYYIEISSKKFEDKTDLLLHDFYFFSPIRFTFGRTIKYCAIKTDSLPVYAYSIGTTSPEVKSARYVSVDLVSRLVGNSIVFTFGFDDNLSACKVIDSKYASVDLYSYYTRMMHPGHYSVRTFGFDEDVLVDDEDEGLGGIPLTEYKYVNNDGECYNYSIVLFSDLSEAPDYDETFEITHQEQTLGTGDYKTVLIDQQIKPFVSDESINGRCIINKKIHKDNKEIIRFNVQLEFCSENNKDIVLTSEFVKRQKIINIEEPFVNAKVYIDNQLDWKNPHLSENAIEKQIISSSGQEIFSLRFNNTEYLTPEEAEEALLEELGENTYIYFTNQNDEVILAANTLILEHSIKIENPTAYYAGITLYANILRQRNKDIIEQ